MKRLLTIPLLLTPLIGCTQWGCAELQMFEYTFEEQCGPAGSQGTLYFGDDMVHLIIGAGFEDFLTEESSLVYDWSPIVTLGFRAIHLEEGTSIGTEELVIWCNRTSGPSTGLNNYIGGEGALTVVKPSNNTQLGGQSWLFDWDVTCIPEAEITIRGEDVIELLVEEHGWNRDLYGLPGDWPQAPQ